MSKQWDDFFWPGETVLRNELGEHDRDVLRAMEYARSAYQQGRIERGEIPVARTFDTAHLQAIHRELFTGIYRWAGEIRDYGMSKGGIGFATPDRIGIYLNDIARVVRDTPWDHLDRDDVVTNAARLYSIGNVAHAFRDGNGRALKVFVNQVVEPSGHFFDWNAIDKPVWDQQSKFSMPDLGEHEPHPEELQPVFARIIRDIPPTPPPIDPAVLEEARHAARVAGAGFPHPPGTTTGKQSRPQSSTPATRPRGRDTDYGR